MKRLLLSGILLFSIVVANATMDVTIKELNEHPWKYKLESVRVKGYVNLYEEEQRQTTDYYILEDEYGYKVRVITSRENPEPKNWYVVEGTFFYDDQGKKMSLSETTRILVTDTQPTPIVAVESDNNVLLYVLIGAGVIVLALIIVVLFITSKKKSQTIQPEPSVFSPPAAADNTPPAGAPSNDDFQTIKIAASTPKTMKFIPGELKIVSGEDQGKSFKIAGYPTPEGNIVSIGREEIKGERAYSHIQLKQKTISRKQAEIISKEGKLFVKNLSETNYTQVDGVELQPGEQVELKPNSTIRAGELEFKYIV